MDLGKIVQSIFDSIFTTILETILAPFIVAIESFMTPNNIENFTFVDPIFGAMQTIAFALLIIIFMWQMFKSMFAWAGFEADEPIRIVIKTIVAGFFIGFSKEVTLYGVNLVGEFMKLVLISAGKTQVDINIVSILTSIITKMLMINTIFAIQSILSIYIMFKIVGLLFKMLERIILCAFLVICSPMAFACGVSQPTKGFLTGFVRTYVGNLIIQLLQTVCFVAIAIYWTEALLNSNLLDFVMIIVIIKVCGKIEDIVRDMSISVGIGREASHFMSNVQQTVNVSQQVVGVASKILGKA